MVEIMLWLTLITGVLIVYHHIGYPILLKLVSRNSLNKPLDHYSRSYKPSNDDNKLPEIHLIMPAYNEAENVADKLRNLAAVDYPSDKLKISLICDGCSDKTAHIARQVSLETECQHLNIYIQEKRKNRGKVAIVNEAVSASTSDIIALSDISALISIDALLIAVAHFNDPKIGVVSGSYRLLSPGSAGEEAYWSYQTAIKMRESATGSTLGVHGAFYLLRRDLFVPLAPDTINDDFILPMQVVAQGYRAVYEPNIIAVELEQSTASLDQSRRKRIAAGNVQQVLRLLHLLNPRFKGVAFNFASGKTLRVLMPFFLLFFLFASAVLAFEFVAFAFLLVSQLIVYFIAIYRQNRLEQPMSKLVETIHYLVSGHYSNLIGACNYLLGKERGFWKRSNI